MEDQRKECIFCRIADHDIPGSIVYEDDEVIAFKDLNPRAPVHILVIPKKHIASLNEITEEDAALLGKIMLTIKRIAQEQGIGASGYRVISNCGKDGLQEVMHLHFHLLGGKPLSFGGFTNDTSDKTDK